MAKQPPLLAHTGQGSQSIVIGWQDFIKGASTSSKIADQGFSPDSYNINLLSNVGELASTAAPVEYTSFSGGYLGIVATCANVDNGGVTGKAIRGVDASGDFWVLNSGTWSSPVGDVTNKYTYGASDIVSFNGNYYASSHNTGTGDNVCKWDGATTKVEDWFHTNFSTYLKLNAPHPMIVFNKNLYIADANMLHKYSEPAGTPTYTPAILTLDTDVVITSLAIDPNSGRMMVGYSQVWGTSTIGTVAQFPSSPKIGLYDGTNPTQFVKIVPMDDIVRVMYSVGGTVYIGYGNTLGIWNGAGVTFLRQLVGFPIKSMFTNIGNNLFFQDNGYLWCYTEITGLQSKVFFKMAQLNLASNSANEVIPVIFNQDANSVIGYTYLDNASVYRLFSLDTAAVGSSTQTAVFYSNRYDFPRPVYIRAMDITTDGALTSSETITPVIHDDNIVSNAFNPGIINSGFTLPTNRLSTDTNPTTSIRFLLTMNTSKPFKRAVIYYDPAE